MALYTTNMPLKILRAKLSLDCRPASPRAAPELHATAVLLLARLAEVGQAEDSDYLIADSRIEPQRHYPVIQFPDSNGDAIDQVFPYQANLTLWMAFEKVDFKTPPIEMADGEERSAILNLEPHCRRDLVVTVQVPKARLAEHAHFFCLPTSRPNPREDIAFRKKLRRIPSPYSIR